MMSERETNTIHLDCLRGEEEYDACRYIRTDYGNGKQEESLPVPLLEERQPTLLPNQFHD